MARGQVVGGVLDLVPASVPSPAASAISMAAAMPSRLAATWRACAWPGLSLSATMIDDRAAEELGVFLAPLARAAGVTRGDHAGSLERVDVFLAFADVDQLAARDRLDDLREPVQDAAGVAEAPAPAALARGVGDSLRELLAGGAKTWNSSLPFSSL